VFASGKVLFREMDLQEESSFVSNNVQSKENADLRDTFILNLHFDKKILTKKTHKHLIKNLTLLLFKNN